MGVHRGAPHELGVRPLPDILCVHWRRGESTGCERFHPEKAFSRSQVRATELPAPPTFVARALGWVCLCVLSLYSCDETSQLRQLREKRVDLGHSFRARGPYGANNLAAGADLRLSREPRVENSHLELQA